MSEQGVARAVGEADHVIATLRAMEPELRVSGIAELSLFGSVARGEARPESDIDLLASIDPALRVGLSELLGLEDRLTEALGRKVDLVTSLTRNPYVRATVERDRKRVF